jgi:hypothetical protein
MTSRMHESARTDLWEPWGSNPPGRPGPELRNSDVVYQELHG